MHRLSLGAPTALFHLLVAALVEAEGLSLYARGGARALLGLPLLLSQGMGVAAIVWLVTAALWRPLVLRVLALLFALAAAVLVASDQLTLKLFVSHLQLGLAEGRIPDLRRIGESALAEADRYTLLNAAALVVLFVLLHAPPIHARVASLAERMLRSPLAAALLGALLAASLRYGPRLDPLGMRTHPLVSLAMSVGASGRQKPPEQCAEVSPERPVQGAPPAPDFSEVRRLAAARKSPPNLIVVVLESVGAVQLLKGGAIDPKLAPRLHALAQHGVLFENVYGVFPATTRTHVPLATGGRTVTWGSVFEDLSLKWKGPTLSAELARAGYREALISAQGLHFENLDGFYKQQRFELVVDPDADEYKPLRDGENGSTWGVSERAVVPLALKWLLNNRGKPFFLQLLTSSTHHPYVAPGVKKLPPRERYDAAIRETDAAVGELLDGLRAAGKLEGTIVAVVGDHGEAFNDLHKGNNLHKSFLYEENIRTFLLVSDARAIPRPLVSPQIAGVADVAPTLLALAGRPPADMPGQDLLSPKYAPRTQLFHTLAEPALWGLRDGRWKYISRQGGERPELYDLATDAGETRNLARAQPERVADAECRCRRWYVRTDDDFNAHLEGRTKKQERLTLADVSKPPPGPVAISLGAGRFHPWEPVAAEVEWTPDTESRDELIEFKSPSGRVTPVTLTLAAGETKSKTELPGPLPLEEGNWTVLVRDDEDDPPMLEGNFTVSEKEKLTAKVEDRLPTAIAFEQDGSDAALVGTWEPATVQLRVQVVLTRPGAPPRRADVALEAGSSAELVVKPPLEAGTWHALVRTFDGRKLGEATLEIAAAEQAQR